MDKNTFINKFRKADKLSVANLYEKITLCEKINRCVYTNEFYTPDMWRVIQDMENELGVSIHLNGVFEDAERRMMGFSQDEMEDFPLVILKIIPKSKFITLEHKDYLGALMSLGIKREKIGDLVVAEGVCYVPICKDIFDYVELNLNEIHHSPCDLEVVEDLELLPKHNFKEMAVNTTSLRIDCVVSSLTGVSRGQSLELISEGKVLLNYSSDLQKDKVIKMESVITIKGYGKFKIVNELGTTAKGRIKLNVKKFI